jgi:hypothetical protein
MGTIAGAAIIGTLVFLRCLGPAVLNPQALDWIFQWGIDPSANFMGWHMFRTEAWGLPPGVLRTYGYPVGSSVGRADALPIVALPMKLLSAWLPAHFQYLGAWWLSCYVLLAVFGALLTATATANPVLQLLGAALFALSPPLIHRMGHPSLSAHWLLAASLWLHFGVRARGLTPGLVAGWSIVLLIAAGTTPYLAAMVAALALPTIVGGMRRNVIRGLAAALSFGVVTVAMWWASGDFQVRAVSDLQNTGFGLLSTNLLAPFYPPDESLMSIWIHIGIMGSDQLDGYCYLGLGLFFLAVAALAIRRFQFGWPRTPMDVAFAVVIVGLTLFAISSTVTLGTRVLARYDPSWWGPLTTFRASGRFIWPVYYAFTFALVASVARYARPRTATIVLSISLVLQVVDLWGTTGNVAVPAPRAEVDPLPSPFWRVVLPQYEHLVLNPTNMCSEPGAGFDYRYFALKAGVARVTINAGYAPRYDIEGVTAYCRTLAADTAARRVEDDTLYVVADGLVPQLETAERPVRCGRVDGFAVCFTAASHERWRALFDIAAASDRLGVILDDLGLQIGRDAPDRQLSPLRSAVTKLFSIRPTETSQVHTPGPA